jgi:hypothetical protein
VTRFERNDAIMTTTLGDYGVVSKVGGDGSKVYVAWARIGLSFGEAKSWVPVDKCQMVPAGEADAVRDVVMRHNQAVLEDGGL